ncbi:MAG: hypothetical protein OEW75_02965 [Cyclobacteriaceae bacterium]|nr:hypothetical protein [Cyclobacteriaceae bacterium]
MRKRTLALLIPLILFLCFYGWLEYRQWKSFQHTLPNDIEMVLKINTDRIYVKMLKYMILHPSTISSKKDSSTSIEKGFSLPANLFLYSRKSSPGSISLSLPLNNQQQASEYLAEKLKLEEINNNLNENWLGYSSQYTTSLSISNNLALFTYPDKLNKPADQLFSTISDNQLVQIVNKLNDTESDLFFYLNNSFINIDFDGDQIHFSGELDYQDTTHSPIPFLNHFLSPNIIKNLFNNLVNKTTLVNLQVEGILSRMDTVITYTYDDDFNKIESKEIKSTPFPGIKLQVVYSDSLSDLKNTKIDFEKFVTEYGLHKEITGINSVTYYNTDAFILNIPKDNKTTHSASINFKSFVPHLLLPSKLDFFDKLNHLDLSMKRNDSGKIELSGVLILNEDVRKWVMNSSTLLN